MRKTSTRKLLGSKGTYKNAKVRVTSKISSRTIPAMRTTELISRTKAAIRISCAKMLGEVARAWESRRYIVVRDILGVLYSEQSDTLAGAL